MKEQLISINVTTDNEGDIYFIPSYLMDEFNKLDEEIAEYDGEDKKLDRLYDKFEKKFKKYKLEGDLSDYQLFISQDELKRLTNE